MRRVLADLSVALGGANLNLRTAPERILGIALAGFAHGLHGHLKWLSRQILPDLATDAFLLRIASVYNITQVPAIASLQTLGLTGTNGTLVPANTVWGRADGVQYKSLADATIGVSGTVTTQVLAQVTGVLGNNAVGDTLTLVGTIAGLTPAAYVATIDRYGVDIESIDSVRARLINRLQQPPRGGGIGDYEKWMKTVAGVTRAWQYPYMSGVGTVGGAFVRDNDASIFPSTNEVADVQAAVDLLKPVTAQFTAFALVPDTINFTIHIVPDTAAGRAAVATQLTQLMAQTVPGGIAGSTTTLAQIDNAVVASGLVTDYTVSVPAANVVPASGHLSQMGTITWV